MEILLMIRLKPCLHTLVIRFCFKTHHLEAVNLSATLPYSHWLHTQVGFPQLIVVVGASALLRCCIFPCSTHHCTMTVFRRLLAEVGLS